MLSAFRQQNKLGEFVFLAFLSVFCFGLSLVRMHFSNSRFLLFLNWNLFLAFIPWVFSTMLIVYPVLQKNKLLVILLLMSWLLLFPNAPYILTDLFHLKLSSAMPMWFDLLLILFFAWTGLMFGFISLWNIERVLNKLINRNIVILISSAFLFMGSFGIYLGRYLRWNSWDIMQRPLGLIYDISDRFTNPFKHPGTWGMTLLMGIFLNMVYWSFKMIKKNGYQFDN